MRGNQTSYRFACALPAAEEYLQLPVINDTDNEAESIEASDTDEHVERSAESELETENDDE